MSTTIQKPPLETHRRFQARVKRLHERQGYFVISLPPQKFINLIAFKDGKTLLIKCKRSYDERRRDLDALRDLALHTACKVILAYTNGRTPIINLRPIP